ncbi:hypothetical protein GCM10017691_16730 [Pseudonocardia petroleophila]|uniref:DUF368 domain-containing protein n=1 Tax=Pseudonocardia petroleophila TaxID=37331 RepID=A0A7G7MHJ9_9PSEU|nr:DUF368 domain-containing protein [Pseudonocardia petroleophila]QNG52260.1 DUF368 domain-containing protein [Pseudonocardia petroleophila]
MSSFRFSHVLRGVAIGSVEVVPGVSGGTVALVVGVYERLISAASHLVSAARATTDVPRGLGWARARAEVARVEWPLVLAVLSGMVLAVLVAARLLPPLIEAHPVGTSALFFGMVAASVAVPLLDLGGLRGVREWVLLVVAAVGTALITGLPPGDLDDPSLWLVAPAAAVAVCALVLPGLSGSFLLLAVGLYEPTLRAVDRDLAYVGTFLLGAVLGLAFFVEAGPRCSASRCWGPPRWPSWWPSSCGRSRRGRSASGTRDGRDSSVVHDTIRGPRNHEHHRQRLRHPRRQGPVREDDHRAPGPEAG